MVVNNSMFAPKSMAVAFQPAQQIMKMVSTINNNLAIRQDSFAKSAELEKQMRMMMLTENEKIEQPHQIQEGNCFISMRKTPLDACLATIDITARYLTRAKDWVSLIQKHEAILTDENSTDEQRANSIKMGKELKNLFEGTLEASIEMHSAFSGGFGQRLDSENRTEQLAEIAKKTGDITPKGLGLTGFANMNSKEILEKLDAGLDSLQKAGDLLRPGYVLPTVEPETKEDLDWFENTAKNWDYIVAMMTDGVPKEPMPKTTLNIYA